MTVFKPPHKPDVFKPTVFLAGSIENGEAENWQEQVTKELEPTCVILNPRRDDWDSTWRCDITNNQFREQVEWELDGLDLADFILFHFVPGTKSPISLMELGWRLGLGTWNKCFVSCPQGFWRKGNVDIMCRRHNVLVYNQLHTAVKALKERASK